MVTVRRRIQENAAAANRLKAQKIKEQLKEAGASKELFPHKMGISHRRSDAFDAADATADLFAQHMQMDGGSDRRSSLASRISSKQDSEVGGFNIRGVAKASSVHQFAIKGTAPESNVKELFPSRGNAGKELFSERLEGRGLRRQKAEDLFH